MRWSQVLTFLVFLCLIRCLVIVPADAVIAPKAVNVRHGVYASPEPAVSKYQFKAQELIALEITRTITPALLCLPI